MSVGDWDSIWKDLKGIDFESENYTWKIYESLLGKNYDYRGKKVVEFGCGTGINTCIMARRGAKVTFVDYSKDALRIVKRAMDAMGVEGELLNADIFDLKLDGFDISHSEGTIEHFRDERRQRIVDIHSNSLKKGGRCVITVPYLKSAPYRVGKSLAEASGTWIYGKEYPYSKKELRARMEKSNLRVERIIGGEFLFSFGWAFAPLWLRSRRILQSSIRQPANKTISRLNYDNKLADNFGRVIAAVGTKR